jgi:hypothetical protein
MMKTNKGLRICGYGMPGQFFYALEVPVSESANEELKDPPIRALVSILEGRSTKFRVRTELQYRANSKWNWDVKRVSGSEFMVTIPSRMVMNLLVNMGQIKFITCAGVVAVVEETFLDPDVFQELQTVWVRALGVPDIARTEGAMMELARLVGDPEEIHIPSL